MTTAFSDIGKVGVRRPGLSEIRTESVARRSRRVDHTKFIISSSSYHYPCTTGICVQRYSTNVPPLQN